MYLLSDTIGLLLKGSDCIHSRSMLFLIAYYPDM